MAESTAAGPALALATFLLGAALPGTGIEAAEPWIDMDYGPYLTHSIEAGKGNLAAKGIAIRLDEGEGGVSRGNEFMLFDTDTLRMAAGWIGPGCIDWRSIRFDGSHGTHASIRGRTVFENPTGPGWGNPGGSFDDPRRPSKDGRRHGPLDRSWARWNGLHLAGRKVVLSYSVGGVEVLELPGSERFGALTALTRTLSLGPRSRDLFLQVAHRPGHPPLLRPFPGRGSHPGELAELASGPGEDVLLVATVGGPEGAAWSASGEGHLRLRVPAGGGPATLKLLFSRVLADEGPGGFQALAGSSPPPEDVRALTAGGPPRWRERPAGRMEPMGPGDGPFAIEDLNPPRENPYRSWMRLSGLDFLEGGKAAALSTWMGDVWLVTGLGSAGDGEGDRLTWQRIATGLYEPLGLKVVGDQVYVLGRDQISRLIDLNGDGETDFYENFNNDAQATEHYHEFAMDLQTDAEGNFYYTKGGRHALDSVVPHHGTLLKVTKDGKRTEILANGFRAPNGLCVNPDGTFMVSDQEGHWTPANRINRVRRGGFYGYLWSYHQARTPGTYEKPLCWVHPRHDISPAEQLWVTSDRWGPLGGQLLSLSYGTGEVSLVLREEVEGEAQGGVVKLPMGAFPTGILRGRFHPGDGGLYLCGLFGWSSQRTLIGGLYRVRWTGKPLHMPIALHATREGMVIGFTDPLERETAGDPRRYTVERWNYKWQERYGSDDHRLSDGGIGRDKVEVRAARVSRDGRAVFLEIPGMAPCMQMRIVYRLRSVDGSRLAQEIYHTIHVLGDPGPHLKMF